MIIRVLTIYVAGLLTWTIAGAAEAPAGWTEVDTAECSDIEFTQTVLDEFPEIASACRGVVRDAQGSPYARVAARVDYVRRDMRTRAVRKVTIALLGANDETLRKISVTPSDDFRFTVDGEQYTAEALSKGMDLGLFLPADRWELVWSPDTATPVDTRVRIEDMETVLVTSTLRADEAFAFDSAELSAAGKASLDAILEATQGYVTSVTIRGYTDEIGNENYNLGLSQRRANAAAEYLVSQGVPANRIDAQGRGESNPVVSCPNLGGEEQKKCLAPNRRTEVSLLIPAVADKARLEVTKTYVNPLGEEVTVNQELNVERITQLNRVADDLLTNCKTEIERHCSDLEAGSGLIVGCLTASANAAEPYSQACQASLASVLDAVMYRRARLDAVGQACSAELAACDAVDVTVEDKLRCIRENRMSTECARMMSNLGSAAF